MNTTILPPARNFAQLVAEIEDGVLHQDLSMAVQDMVATLINHHLDLGGKPKGSISLKLDIKLDGGTIDITPEIKISKPKSPRGKSVFYATPENNLSRSNPKQREMFIKDISVTSAETKAV